MTTKDTDDRPVVEQLPAGGETVNKDISRQRRKIIKASAAVVPAIMTIRSGAAAAAMTSLHACVDKDAARSAAKVVYEAPDEWVRVAGMEVTYKDTSTAPPTYIKLYGIPNKGAVPGIPDNYTDWYDKNGSTTNAKGKVYEVKKKEFETPEDKVVYLLVHVDIGPEGNEFFMYPKDATLMSDQMSMDGSQITASCMCSVDPNFTMVP